VTGKVEGSKNMHPMRTETVIHPRVALFFLRINASLGKQTRFIDMIVSIV
jgi:hypothetical protein